jgi:HAMP domain-containing protein
MAWTTYSDLHQTILSGFDKKLYAVSIVTSSFIDANDHVEILNARQIRGLAYDPVSKILYGSYAIQDYIVKLNVETGSVNEIGPVGFEVLGDMAYDPRNGVLYGIDEDNGRLIQIDTQSGKGKTIGSIGFKGYGLAFDTSSNAIYSNNENLIKIDPVSGKGTSIGPIGFDTVKGLAFDSNTNTLYGVNIKDNKLIRIDIRTGAGKAVGPLIWNDIDLCVRNKSDDSKSVQPLELGSFGLTFDPGKNLLYGSTTIPLVKIVPTTARTTVLEYKSAYDNEKGLYLKYVHPMINIMQRLDLSYLFTCVLKGRGEKLSYVLDATQDETHSFVGYEDVDEPDEKLKDVWLKGNIYLSDINYWEEWGLLKSAYSPIFDSNDEIRGIAGTDVNISIIKKKTRAALLRVCLIGLLSLVIGIWVSVYITRKLAEPIGQLKDIALHVAAGQYGDQIKINEPLELGKLSIAFNEMSQSLIRTFSELTTSNQELESQKCRHELMRILAREVDEKKYAYPRLLAHGYFFSKEHSYNSSGWVSKADKFIMWLADSPEDALKSVKIKRDIYGIVDRLYDSYSEDLSSNAMKDWIEFRDRLKHLFEDDLYCLCLFDPKNGRLKTFTRRPVQCLVLDHSNGNQRSLRPQQIIELSQTDTVSLRSGQALVISSLNLADLLTNSGILSDFYERATRVFASATNGEDSELDASYLLSVLTDLVEKSSITRDARDDGIVCLYTRNQGPKLNH